MAFPDVLLSIRVMVLTSARQCVFLAGMTRDKVDTATSMGSLLPLETFGGAGSCGVHQECASPRQGMLHIAAPPGLSCPLTTGHRGWSQTTWEKPFQASCSQIRERTPKRVFLELCPGQA